MYLVVTNCNTLQHAAAHCNTLQHTTTHYNSATICMPSSPSIVKYHHIPHCNTHRSTLQCSATHCNTLQHTATHCNTLQHTATHCNSAAHYMPSSPSIGTCQYVPHCNTLQYTATHYNTLQQRYPLYVFKSQQWDATKPTCLVTGGVHGYETSGVQVFCIKIYFYIYGICTYIHIYTYIYIYSYIFIYRQIDIHTRARTHTHTHIGPVALSHAVCMDTYLYIYVCIYIYIYTHVFIYRNPAYPTLCM